MRLRNVTGSREMIAESDFTMNDPEQNKGHWKDISGGRPIHIEVGMGKGAFITGMAQAHPDIHYIGIEKYSTVLLRAVQKQAELMLPNLTLLRFDAEYITDLFDKDEVDRIYLNFSDPWPKDRHAGRRLTSGRFLEKYTHFLKDGGCVCFKTDNRDLFDFSVEEAKQNNWRLEKLTYDLHHSEYMEGNIMTEYEEKFSSKGNPIYRFESFKPF